MMQGEKERSKESILRPKKMEKVILGRRVRSQVSIMAEAEDNKDCEKITGIVLGC